MNRRTLDMPEAHVEFFPDFFAPERADRLLRELLASTEWRQDSMKIFGRPTLLPRLTGWYGDPGVRYVYSGIVNEPEFGEKPVIASASFGATRRFQFRHKRRKDLKEAVDLAHGSLLVMRGLRRRAEQPSRRPPEAGCAGGTPEIARRRASNRWANPTPRRGGACTSPASRARRGC